ncbi:MAG: NADH-quinone oxidoreductase subunit C [Desulfovibrio sp.]
MLKNEKIITLDTVYDENTKLFHQGLRMITVTCIELDEESLELIYHWDDDLDEINLRLTVKKTDVVPSLTPANFGAFLIENEIQDQFGLKFDGLALDFGGKLYLTGEVKKTPFCRYAVSE